MEGAEEIAEAPEVEVVEEAAVDELSEATKEEDADVVVVAEVAAEEVAASGPFVGGVVLQVNLVAGLKSMVKRARLSDVA